MKIDIDTWLLHQKRRLQQKLQLIKRSPRKDNSASITLVHEYNIHAGLENILDLENLKAHKKNQLIVY
jgi:hypothetical protein